jgi:hypothetical protein
MQTRQLYVYVIRMGKEKKKVLIWNDFFSNSETQKKTNDLFSLLCKIFFLLNKSISNHKYFFFNAVVIKLFDLLFAIEI